MCDSYITTQESRQICGIGGTRISVPLVQVDIISDLVCGLFELGVCKNLPNGIDLLAGNDLFDSGNIDTCVVTRSQTAVERAVIGLSDNANDSNSLTRTVEPSTIGNEEIMDADLELSWLFDETKINPVPIASIVNRDMLIKLQQADNRLKKYMLKAQLVTELNGD